MKITAKHLNEQRAYMALCDRARELGIPTSLDDPRSPKTVAALKAAVRGGVDA
jgi:hypothetical protein